MTARKYRKGHKIRSMIELARADMYTDFYIVQFGSTEKTLHRGWLLSWQYRQLELAVQAGRIWAAERIKDEVD